MLRMINLPPHLYQTSDESKKRKRAKTLVEKAKVIQQSMKAVVKEQKPVRRSSRSEATTKRSYCEDEVQLKANNSDGSLATGQQLTGTGPLFN